MAKLRVFTAFSGYDSQCLALDLANVDYELIGWSEVDKYAIKAHNTLFPQYADRNYGDITKIDWSSVPDFDLFTYSSPCQSFSIAGRQDGGEEGSGTASSLLWYCRMAILTKKPKYLIMENVKNLVSKKFLPTFLKWEEQLRSYGYSNFSQVMNAKDYGVPQNRERIFVVSILGNDEWFSFPEKQKLVLRLKDILDEKVDEKYYLSKEMVEKCVILNKGRKTNTEQAIIVGKLNLQGRFESACRVYSTEGISPALVTCSGGGITPKIIENEKHLFGVSRSRNKEGQIVKSDLKDYVMCITSFSAMGHPTMWSLVAEIEAKRPDVGGAVMNVA